MFHQLWGFLEPFGFSVFDLYDLQRARNGQLRYGDVLFVSEEVRAKCLDTRPEEA